MSEKKEEPRGVNSGQALIKGLLLLAFIIAAVLVVRLTPVKEIFSSQTLGSLLETSGFWAPLVFILVYTLGICLFIPGTILTALGAAIFGPYWGFIYAWIGAMAGATATFTIGRYLGRDFAASMIGDRLQKYDDGIENNGFTTVLYLRLLYVPFTPTNFGMGLTKVRFWDYFWGTGLGILVGTFIFSFFFGTIKEVGASGNWDQLLSWKIIFSVVLFILSFFIPTLIKRIKQL